MKTSAEAFKDWEFMDWMDLNPLPGSFVSPTWDDYEVHGETIRALNWLHAEYTWLHRQIERSGEVFGVCCHCNHFIRYAVIFRDGNGFVHMVGQACAQFIQSKLDRSEFLEKRLISEMKEVDTKRGKRFVTSMEVPSWYWDVAREQRPKYASLSSYEKPTGRRPVKVWKLSIWGETPGEVVENVADFRQLRRRLEACNAK